MSVNLIKNILKKESPSFNELIDCFEQVKRNGNVVVIKFDGERSENGYTIFISFPLLKNKEMIREDTNDLKTGLMKALSKYLEIFS
ncbi:hypothetical protein [Arsenicibacter rosenii]|uniref:Uncharacterized protein n=1 Tax=Arsenicibacter rosenii TaxID=1750698 RepID=A0A1S2VBM5_9BACT|nr:hypothetical protein [Arsenicibacter rosenii]OIN55616.1 hypothetical protein BLX24_29180 [Arsenicibacter rosenii]